MPAGGDDLAAVVHIDVVPVRKIVENLCRAFGVDLLQVLHRLVGEHHAPAECIVRLVALDDLHPMARIEALQRQREIKPRRPAADANCFHGRNSAIGCPAVLAAYARQARMSSCSRSGKSRKISSAVTPSASIARISATGTRILRMQGHPWHWSGWMVFRDSKSLMSRIYPVARAK